MKAVRGEEGSVLVLGGAGYLGSVVTRLLRSSGWRVRIYDRFIYGTASLAGLAKDRRVEVIAGDVRDEATLGAAMKGCTAVVHLAAIVGDPACEVDREQAREINVEGTRIAFRLAEEAGIKRFIFTSTCSVYGCSDSLLDESSFLYPLSYYAQTKLVAEHLLLSLYKRSPMLLTIFRLATLFGWSPRARFDLVVNAMTASALSRGELTVFGGEQWRPHLHVNDAASAIAFALAGSPAAVDGEIFNLGGEALNMKVLDLGQAIAGMIPGCRLEVKPEQQDLRNYRVSFAKVASRLGFRTRYGIRDGVREILGNYALGKVRDFSLPIYHNVRALEARIQVEGRQKKETSAERPVAAPG